MANYNPHITGWYSARYIRNNPGFFIYVWSPSQVKCHSSSWVSSAWSQIHSWHPPPGPGAAACSMMPSKLGASGILRYMYIYIQYIGLVWFSKGAINIHQPMDGRYHQIIYFFVQILEAEKMFPSCSRGPGSHAHGLHRHKAFPGKNEGFWPPRCRDERQVWMEEIWPTSWGWQFFPQFTSFSTSQVLQDFFHQQELVASGLLSP